MEARPISTGKLFFQQAAMYDDEAYDKRLIFQYLKQEQNAPRNAKENLGGFLGLKGSVFLERSWRFFAEGELKNKKDYET